MKNSELFAEYGTEKWAVEENLCFLLQEYWEELQKKNSFAYKFPTCLPINPVGFVKNFMKEETLVNIEYAEQSKMEALKKNIVADVPVSSETIIDADYKELDSASETGTTKADKLKIIWPE